MSEPTIRELIAESNPEALFADGFDEAIIGMCENTRCAVYSVQKCVDVLIRDDGMTEEDAWEHLYYNAICGYVGEFTPIWVNVLRK